MSELIQRWFGSVPNSVQDWAALVAILGAGVSATAFLLRVALRRSRLKITAADFGELPADPWNTTAWPVVTLAIENRGSKVAVTSRVECEVVEAWPLERQFPIAQAMPPSAEYGFVVDPTRARPYQTDPVVAVHKIPPDDADRLQFTIRAAPAKPFEVIFRLEIRIRYDGERAVATSVVVVAPIITGAAPEYFFDEYLARKARHEEQIWANPQLKAVADSLFDDTYAKAVDERNRRALLAASEIDALFSPRAQQLIKWATRSR